MRLYVLFCAFVSPRTSRYATAPAIWLPPHHYCYYHFCCCCCFPCDVRELLLFAVASGIRNDVQLLKHNLTLAKKNCFHKKISLRNLLEPTPNPKQSSSCPFLADKHFCRLSPFEERWTYLFACEAAILTALYTRRRERRKKLTSFSLSGA